MTTNTIITRDQQRAAVDAAISEFGSATFGARAFPGRVFRISPDRMFHYFSQDGGVQLVIEVLSLNGEWMQFSRTTPDELRNEIVRSRR